MAATAGEMGIPFQLTGSLALDLHGVLRRRRQTMNGRPMWSVNVNLTTPQNHQPDRAVERIAGALLHSGWEATVIDGARPDHPMSRSVRASGRGLPEPVALTTTMLPEYAKPPTQYIDGLAVSPLPTLLLRTVQQIQLRRDPRDYIDLVAMEDALGPDTVERWTTAWLDRQAGKSPDAAVRLYEGFHLGLSRVMTVSVTELASHGLGRPEIGEVKDKIVHLARRVAERVPTAGGGAKNSLQRLLSMSDDELAEMRAAADALGMTSDEVERRVTSPAEMAEQRLRAQREAVAAAAEQRFRGRPAAARLLEDMQTQAGQAHQQRFPDQGARPSMN
ncbi:hypothetical protein ACH419_31155 [Streptomyces bobili]|uniref:hypothetical protein n=1 Tax=Streptomyces bobili TaxID=67280 RepID=UPI003788BF8E